ncbi:MAG: hypothetical protein ACHQE5_00870 [Actinomycetes bacterium]
MSGPSDDMLPPPAVATRSDASETLAAELRTPRAAGLAGIVFALTLGAVAILWRSAIPTNGDSSAWITDSSRRHALNIALLLIPYAGIAFLWFIGVIRSRLGAREDKLFATAFLGSGLLFVGMLFTAAALMGGLLALYDTPRHASLDNIRLVGAVSTTLLTTFSIRMAAVFTLVVTNLGWRTRIVPRWLAVVGFATALVLLLAPPHTVWATMLFPTWVLLVSLVIIFTSGRTAAPRPA